MSLVLALAVWGFVGCGRAAPVLASMLTCMYARGGLVVSEFGSWHGLYVGLSMPS